MQSVKRLTNKLGLRAALAAAMSAIACGAEREASPPTSLPTAGAAVTPATQSCDLAGTWALRIKVGVRWGKNLAMEAGEGEIVQYARVTRTHAGDYLIDEAIHPCGVVVPAMTKRIRPVEHYALRFEDSVFDESADRLPAARTRTHFEGGMVVGSEFESGWAATQIGIDLGDPGQAPWPRREQDLQSLARNLRDNMGNFPGIPATPDQDDHFVAPALGLKQACSRATRVFLAIRNVEKIGGRIDSCDHATGFAEVKREGDTYLLDSSVVGCEVDHGRACTAPEIKFMNQMLPKMVASGNGTMSMTRVHDDVTCQDIRAAHFH